MDKKIDDILWSITGILIIGAVGAISALSVYKAYPNTYWIILVVTMAVMYLYDKYKKIIQLIIKWFLNISSIFIKKVNKNYKCSDYPILTF